MARPLKSGIDYFPLDVDIDTADDRIILMESDYGVEGFGILIKILMRIYHENGYFIVWDENKIKRFCHKNHVDIGLCKDVVKSCVKSGFFDKLLYKKYQILTSRGIQKRYLEACERRKKVVMIRDFLLLNLAIEINANINLVFVNINSINDYKKQGFCIHDVSKNTQSKTKQSKIKQNAQNKNSPETAKTPPTASPRASPSAHPPEFNSLEPKNPEEKTQEAERQRKVYAQHLKETDNVGYMDYIKVHPELADKKDKTLHGRNATP